MMRYESTAAAVKTERLRVGSLRIMEAAPAAKGPQAVAESVSVSTLRVLREGAQKAWIWLERKRTQQLSSRRLRVAETISLGEKRSVSIVQVDGSQFLIGCSTASVQLLAVLDMQESGARVAKFEGGV